MATETQQSRSIPARKYTRKSVTLYVCPHPECPDYYGSTNMTEMESRFSGPKPENRHYFAEHDGEGSGERHSLAECPTCRMAGRGQRERVKVHVGVNVPTVGPPTPERPKL